MLGIVRAAASTKPARACIPPRCSWSKLGSDVANAAVFGTLLPFAFTAASEVSMWGRQHRAGCMHSQGAGLLVPCLARLS